MHWPSLREEGRLPNRSILSPGNVTYAPTAPCPAGQIDAAGHQRHHLCGQAGDGGRGRSARTHWSRVGVGSRRGTGGSTWPHPQAKRSSAAGRPIRTCSTRPRTRSPRSSTGRSTPVRGRRRRMERRVPTSGSNSDPRSVAGVEARVGGGITLEVEDLRALSLEASAYTGAQLAGTDTSLEVESHCSFWKWVCVP